jgi:hypothetical protein
MLLAALIPLLVVCQSARAVHSLTMGDSMMDQTGRCRCGDVEFQAKGKILFRHLCHCRACAWAASVTPVHIVGVGMPKPTYHKGEDKVVITKGLGKMLHARCSECGTQVYQKPGGQDNFVALFPPTFHIGGEDSIDQRLPVKYLPKFHANYENRARDTDDSIPKFKTYPPDNEMNHDGTFKDN